MLLNSFDDYMFYSLVAHIFHVSMTTAYWTTNTITAGIMIAIVLVCLIKR